MSRAKTELIGTLNEAIKGNKVGKVGKDGKCPRGHELPYEHANGHCEANRCGADKTATPATTDKRALRKAGGATEQSKLVEREERQRQGFAVSRKAIRETLVPVPKITTADEIEAYADKKALELLPDALATLEYNLKYGDDKERTEAMHDVLDMNGRRKREALTGGSQTIILNFSNNQMPWETAKTIEATKSSKSPTAQPAEPLALTAGRVATAGAIATRPAQVLLAKAVELAKTTKATKAAK